MSEHVQVILVVSYAPALRAHRTVEELLEMRWEDWNESINKLDTRTKTAAGKRGKDVDRCSKTGAEYIYTTDEDKSGIYRIIQTTNHGKQIERA